MRRKPFICGNWKLHYGVEETRATLKALIAALPSGNVDVGIAPVTTTLFAACEAAKGSRVHIAAQNVHWAEKGAYTGEWSVAHLKELGCSHVIIGHSERRQYFGETNDDVAKKVRAVLDGGLLPIACVGESLEERESGATMKVIERQVAAITDSIDRGDVDNLTVAYEPVWAIGTGKTATALQAQEVHAAIRGMFRGAFGEAAERLRIQYGGSVKADNAAELMSEPDVDGALVGGASLDPQSFAAIIAAAAATRG